MQKKILYWSPHLTNIGTINSVVNSVKSLEKFSPNKFKINILNLFGEWSVNEEFKKNYDSYLTNIFNPNIFRFIPKNSFLKSRFSYTIFFILSFFKLKNILKDNEGAILIIHLLTSLPLIVVTVFNIDIDIILRISGRVKYNSFRKFIWKKCKHKIKFVTCPSNATKAEIIKLNLFKKDIIVTLYDPIIETKKILELKREKIKEKKILNKKYFLGIGRLTRQKNFIQLIKGFGKINKFYPEYILVILGSGEEEAKLNRIIKNNNLQDKVFLLGFKRNVYKYLENCECFISCSRYEDPGASIVQAISCNKFVISSNCENGPAEILLEGKGGILFDLYNQTLEETIKRYFEMSKVEKKKNIINAKKNILKFSVFRHHNSLINLFEKI